MRLHSVSGKMFVTALFLCYVLESSEYIAVLVSLHVCMYVVVTGRHVLTCVCHAHKHVYDVDETWIYYSCACTKHSSKIDYLGFVVATSWHSILLLVSASCACIQTVNKQGLFSKLKFQPLCCAKYM